MNKEQAMEKHLTMTKKSATWNAWSLDIQQQYIKGLEHDAMVQALKGSYDQRWNVIQLYFMTFARVVRLYEKGEQ